MVKSMCSAVSAVALASALVVGLVSGPALAGAPGGIISEVKIGLFDHDAFRDNKGKQAESDTVDVNGEILSVPLVFGTSTTPALNALFQPRAHIGFSANTEGWTNTGYGGLTWDWNLGSNFFVAFSFGFAGHDGQLKGKRDSNGAYITDGRPNLGSAVLFREGLDFGYNIDQTNSISIYAGHMSNAGWFAKENDGMNFVGGRYGFRFN